MPMNVYENSDEYAISENGVTSVAVLFRGKNDEQARATAYAMAAAPELLAACESAQELLTDYHRSIDSALSSGMGDDDDAAELKRIGDTVRQIMQAILKAKG